MTQYYLTRENELYHWGIKGQKWGQRRYQNEDGTLTPEGRERYRKIWKNSGRMAFISGGYGVVNSLVRLNKRRTSVADYLKDIGPQIITLGFGLVNAHADKILLKDLGISEEEIKKHQWTNDKNSKIYKARKDNKLTTDYWFFN